MMPTFPPSCFELIGSFSFYICQSIGFT